MEFYKPLQYLKLVYDRNRQVIKLVSNINVLVGQFKALIRKKAEPSGLTDYLIEYFVTDDESREERYTDKDVVEFDIIPKWVPDNSETDLIDQVANAIKIDLGEKKASFYRVTVEIYLKNEVLGGKVTTTISNDGDIVID